MAENGDVYHVEYDEDEAVTKAVIRAAAVCQNTNPKKLPPLERDISCDALRELITKGDEIVIGFSYAGVDIIVRDGETIVIHEPE